MGRGTEVPRIDHVNIQTRDAARMRTFLSSVLGVEEGFRPPFTNPGHWLYFKGDDHAAVHLDVIAADADLPLGAINHVAFAFLDLQVTMDAVQSCGYPFTRAEMPGTGIIQIFVSGPESVRVEIQCRPDT